MTENKHDFWVTLEDRHTEEWMEVLGLEWCRRLPVLSPFVQRANLPGFSGPQEVYLLAIDVLPQEVLQRIQSRLAAKFGMTVEEAAAEVKTAGIPIREAHVCSVTVLNPQKWL